MRKLSYFILQVFIQNYNLKKFIYFHLFILFHLSSKHHKAKHHRKEHLAMHSAIQNPNNSNITVTTTTNTNSTSISDNNQISTNKPIELVISPSPSSVSSTSSSSSSSSSQGSTISMPVNLSESLLTNPINLHNASVMSAPASLLLATTCNQQMNKCGMPRAANLSITNAPVHIDVGGCIYTSSLETLTKYSESRLSKMFNGSIPIVLDTLKQHYFIDRDGKSFRYVLNFMRTGRVVLPERFDDYETLIEEAKYYGLELMVKQLDDLIHARKKFKSNDYNNSVNNNKNNTINDDSDEANNKLSSSSSSLTNSNSNLLNSNTISTTSTNNNNSSTINNDNNNAYENDTV
jgi:hypothetical protein